MKTAYVCLVLSSDSSGAHSIARKLDVQAGASRRAKLPIDFFWFTREFSGHKYENLLVRTTALSHKLRCRYWQAKELNALLDRYDKVILRYPCYDPILAFFLRDKKRIVLEHHAKELEELKLMRDPRHLIERSLGTRWLSQFGGLTAVTQEIADYEKRRAQSNIPSKFFPNSIDTAMFAAAEGPLRTEGAGTLQLILAASEFMPWHGLDRILEELEKNVISSFSWQLHLIGKLSEPLRNRAKAIPQIKLYGLLRREEVVALYHQMHVGVGPFGLDRKDLKEATSLKVREYLACGVPVVLDHRDPAFPIDYPFVLTQPTFNLAQIDQFVRRIAQTSRAEIQKSAGPFIDSVSVTRDLIDFASALPNV